MNNNQLRLIAHAIALSSGLPYNKRMELEYMIIEKYNELEDNIK